MKKIIFLVCLILIFSGTASAKQLSVKKIIQNTGIKTGDSVSIVLEFENPFNKSVPVSIQDNNVLGSNGLEIQCYEYTLPDKPRMTLSYDFQIQAFSAGDFTLDAASITYTNPDTGSQETVKSEPVKFSIKQGAASGQQQNYQKMQEEQPSLPYWLLIFLIVPLIGMYLYKKYRNNSKIETVESVPEVHIDPKEEALARLERAVEIFNNGLQREAYVEASSAVRTYLKGTLGINELTSDEILNSIKGSKDERYIEDVRQCFILCDLVKFAKYEPNPEDFNRAIEHAKRIIV